MPDAADVEPAREAVVLVGGMGTRLRPLTVRTPKPMLPFAGVPFLVHLLARLRAVGVERVVLATSFRPEVFSDSLGDGSALGLDLVYVTEDSPLGTGGGIRNVAGQLRGAPDDPVWILNGDNLSGHDMAAQLRRHADAGADVTLHLLRVEDPRPFGCVPLDADGAVTAFLEKSPEPVTDLVNAGCYIFRRRVVDAIPTGRPVSVERETFPGLLADRATVVGYVDTAPWLDAGTPASFVAGSARTVRGEIPSPALPGPPGECLVLAGATVDDTARIGDGSVVGAGCVVESGARVDASVVMADAHIGAGAVVVRSAVGAGAWVGPACTLVDATVGDGARIGGRNELLAGVRVWPGVEIPESSLRFSTDV